jgi:hypothetical protein
MAYNFPDAPPFNQVYQDYKWDGQKWILAYGGTGMPNPPSSALYWVGGPSRAGIGAAVFYDDGLNTTWIV